MSSKQYNWEEIGKTPADWFADAKFGLFFHWGPYSVPAYKNEWYSRNMYEKGSKINRHHVETYGDLHTFGYKDFYDKMDGSKFDADCWADLVVRSGAKYAGPVTEHADNFSMWDSRVNPVNCVNYGPKRDITGACAEAFRKRGIRVLSTFHHQWLWGWFMSTDPEADVYLPENEVYYGPALPLETNRYLPCRYPDEQFCRMWLEKVKEVIDRYHPDALYFDSRTCIIDEKYRFEMAKYYYEHCKDGVITYKQEDLPKGVGVYDIECGQFAKGQDFTWQTDERLEDNITWCMVQDPKYRSAGVMIHHLCDIVSKNGNLLLNVGPYADGSFHPDAVKILYEMGDWLAQNGEAIYATRPFAVSAEGPSDVGDGNYDKDKIEAQIATGEAADNAYGLFTEHDFRFTAGHDAVYAIAFAWPKAGSWEIRSLRAGGVAGRIRRVSMLATGETLTFQQDEHALHVTAPGRRPCNYAYALKIETEA